MKVVFCAVLFVVMLAACQGRVGMPCTMKEQCAADECCQIINIVVASKKRQALVDQPPGGAGTCQPYKPEGAYCESFETMNGFCGCAEGLQCQTIHVGTGGAPGGKRGALPPGWEERCIKV
ncbi:hypothetical protein BaRGS_00015436 [Batillaria attramentaria]|uniref:Uncharacterized protein n=1 Tax=Batillaria attramentaria TaxID=370345 RepID=A0ABD0L1G7_9CAEN